MDFVTYNDYRRVLSVIGDRGQPVLRIHQLSTIAAIQDQQRKSPLGQEELMCGMHDLLPTEIPDVQLGGFGLCERQRPNFDGDPAGDGFIGIEAPPLRRRIREVSRAWFNGRAPS
jgi:hypothetical protein